MSFIDWLFSNRPEGLELKNDPWGLLHIIVLLSCIGISILISVLFKDKKEKKKHLVLFIIAMVVLFFEISRRVINFTKGDFILDDGSIDFKSIIYILLPRPWCAISCWVLISSIFIKKKFFYNFAAITLLLNAVIFFAYPSAGFKNHIAFEEVYSIVTHSMLLIGSISMITLGFTDFRYKRGNELFIFELLAIIVVYIYATLLIVFDIEKDPLYFMPGNDIEKILNLPYIAYLILYIIFVFGIWFNSFYLIPKLVKKVTNNFTK